MGKSNKRASWKDNVAEKVWNDRGRNQEERMPAEKFGRYQTETEELPEIKERLALIETR